MGRNSEAGIPSPDGVRGGQYHSDMGIGTKVKERRLELARLDPVRYSVETTAKAAGMRPSTLYGFEREDQKTTPRLHALCKYLGLNIDWVERGIGPRLVGGRPSPVHLVQPDHPESATPTGATDVAMLMKEITEATTFLFVMPDEMRTGFLTAIRAVGERYLRKPDRDDGPQGSGQIEPDVPEHKPK